MTDPTIVSPLVTFALLSYNQESFIREAVEGALSQNYEPLEIILSDDCSSDRTYEIIHEIAASYEGPHTLRIRRSEKNQGLASHFNAVMQEAAGEICVLAAGDDVSLPDRTKISVDCLQENPSATAVLLSADVIDQTGQVVGERLSFSASHSNDIQTLSHLLRWQHVTFGAARAFRKSTFDSFGPLNPNCPTEDTPLLLRSLICGENILSPKKAVKYRRHGSNLSSVSSLRAMNIDEIYSQYGVDISKAQELGLISESDAHDLMKWIVDDQKIRELRLQFKSGRSLGFKELLRAILHPATGVREKVKFIFNVFKMKRIGLE
jgi:glycosyltransferase involved in cell wall biosynthesis